MLLIGVMLITAIVAVGFLEGESKEKVMNEFCNAECRQNILKKYNFCCQIQLKYEKYYDMKKSECSKQCFSNGVNFAHTVFSASEIIEVLLKLEGKGVDIDEQ